VRDVRPGLEAKFDGVCSRCDDHILRGDRIVHHRGHPIHVRCASGVDE
jgi:hypothetical protein